MKIAIDFDGTIVNDEHDYDDLKTPLEFKKGAKEALLALKAADHILILWSGRANPWLFKNPEMDPLVMAGVTALRSKTWPASAMINRARYMQMLAFVNSELPDVFDLIWEHQGKPSVDVFIDDRAMRLGNGMGGCDWAQIRELLGEG